MHSIWQEGITFPDYPILKSDKDVDILYIGATLQHAVDAHFAKEEGYQVMMIEENTISQMPELGRMGILTGESEEEIKNLHRIRDYIAGRKIPCDMKVQTDQCIWVHPVKLFLFLTEDIDVYEQTKMLEQVEHRVDVGSAYIYARNVVEQKKQSPMNVHVFSGERFPEVRGNYQVMRSYEDRWLIGNQVEEMEGEEYHWKI